MLKVLKLLTLTEAIALLVLSTESIILVLVYIGVFSVIVCVLHDVIIARNKQIKELERQVAVLKFEKAEVEEELRLVNCRGDIVFDGEGGFKITYDNVCEL